MEMKAFSLVKVLISKYKNNLLFKRLLTVLSIDILVKLSGIILLPVYLRLMTQEEYGLYGYLISIILTFSLVLNFGLYIPLSKFYHDYDSEEKGRLLFTIFALLASILICVILPIYYFQWDYQIVKILFKNPINYSYYRSTVLLAIIVSVLNFMLINFFFTSEKLSYLKKYNIWRIISINLITIGALYLLKNKDSVRVRLESTYIIESILFLAFSFVFIKEMKPTFHKKLAVASLKLALPIMVSAVFGIVINFGDKFFLEKYGSFKDLSYYYLAVSCASVIPTIFISFQNAWLPLFLKEKDIQKNIAKTNKLMLRLLVGLSILSICIVVFLKIILGLGIIQDKYLQSVYILPFLLISQIFSALVPLYTNYLVYFEKTYITSITGLTLCAISFGLSILLIPRYGVYGAASVSLISNMSYLIIYYFIIKTYTKKHLILKYPIVEQ
jgi:O-antigen/teichoic acid export membrane protein